MESMVGFDEDLPVAKRQDVYPKIDPKVHFEGQTFRGKVVLVTGASCGIGQEIAFAFAKAGASVTIVARSQASLDETVSRIQSTLPSARVFAVSADVSDSQAARAAVQATVDQFGRLDILVPNAGVASKLTEPMEDKDPDAWWHTFEVNLRGVFNFVHPSIQPLQESGNGYIIIVSGAGAQLRIPFGSDYATSKHAVGRLVEFIALEHPQLKVFSMDPGTVDTELVKGFDFKGPLQFVDPQLPVSTALYLASGGADWLNGRYLSATWDLEEAERDWKDKILANNGLVSKLHIPSSI
ncbi:NAD-P-binding protein [Gloeopeniophorella convolvens]|nr:NAD-P-binding protein [Gloeopeniophorella convolvens]